MGSRPIVLPLKTCPNFRDRFFSLNAVYDIFLIPILVGAFGWCLVWAISIMPFKWPYLADKWIGQIDLAKLIPELTKNDPFEAMKPVINDKLDDFLEIN